MSAGSQRAGVVVWWWPWWGQRNGGGSSQQTKVAPDPAMAAAAAVAQARQGRKRNRTMPPAVHSHPPPRAPCPATRFLAFRLRFPRPCARLDETLAEQKRSCAWLELSRSNWSRDDGVGRRADTIICPDAPARGRKWGFEAVDKCRQGEMCSCHSLSTA
jgi:hypothetical protein